MVYGSYSLHNPNSKPSTLPTEISSARKFVNQQIQILKLFSFSPQWFSFYDGVPGGASGLAA